MRKAIVSILLVLMVLSAVFAGGAGESTAGAAAFLPDTSTCSSPTRSN